MLLRFCFLLFLLTTHLHSIESRKRNGQESGGYLIADNPSWGRLGNQLFITSALLAYSWDNDFIPIFPALDNTVSQLAYNKERIFYRLDCRKLPIEVHRTIKHEGLSYRPIRKVRNHVNLAIHGQFVSWKYFHHHHDEIVATFAPSLEVSDYLFGKYKELIDGHNTVAVHVRTYSKEHYDQGYPFLGMKYYQFALEQFPADSIFVIFSDRINWCKKHFCETFPSKNLVFIEGNDHVEDLYLMSMMKHQIISNSTYSWWGAYLNVNPDKIVLCPKQFFRNASALRVGDLFLPEWRILSYDFVNDPYPSDMRDYDELTMDDLIK